MSDSFRTSSFAEPTHTPQGDGKRTIHVTLHGSPPEPTHTPQGDGKSSVRHRRNSRSRNQLTPRKGTEKAFLRIVSMRLLLNQLTPRKGTENFVYAPTCAAVTNQLTPRKGTENPHWSPLLLQFGRTNSHPARGRKIPCTLLVRLNHREPTHTPQGDGKRKFISKSRYVFRTNSHPARGQTNRRNFSARHRCGRKVPSVF